MTRYLLRSLFTTLLLLAGCSDVHKEETTKSPYSKQELEALMIRAELNDIAALRELDLHYGFSGMDEQRENIFRRRVELEDPEALDENAMRLALEAQRMSKKSEKLAYLDKALRSAQRAATLQDTPIDKGLIINYILREKAKAEAL